MSELFAVAALILASGITFYLIMKGLE